MTQVTTNRIAKSPQYGEQETIALVLRVAGVIFSITGAACLISAAVIAGKARITPEPTAAPTLFVAGPLAVALGAMLYGAGTVVGLLRDIARNSWK